MYSLFQSRPFYDKDRWANLINCTVHPNVSSSGVLPTASCDRPQNTLRTVVQTAGQSVRKIEMAYTRQTWHMLDALARQMYALDQFSSDGSTGTVVTTDLTTGSFRTDQLDLGRRRGLSGPMTAGLRLPRALQIHSRSLDKEAGNVVDTLAGAVVREIARRELSERLEAYQRNIDASQRRLGDVQIMLGWLQDQDVPEIDSDVESLRHEVASLEARLHDSYTDRGRVLSCGLIQLHSEVSHRLQQEDGAQRRLLGLLYSTTPDLLDASLREELFGGLKVAEWFSGQLRIVTAAARSIQDD